MNSEFFPKLAAIMLVGLIAIPVRAEDPVPGVDFARAVKMQSGIYTMLYALAVDSGDSFPNDPGDANVNFRRLFLNRLIDDEKIFGFAGDGWIQPGKPDGDIGQHPVFAQALEPGELSIAYVAGLGLASAPDLPLMIGGAGPAIEWITGKLKKAPAKIYTGEVVVTWVNGKTELLKPDPDGKIRQMKDGKNVDIFSAEFGTDPSKIMLPAMLPAGKKNGGNDAKPESEENSGAAGKSNKIKESAPKSDPEA